jgi:hypothetical protein
MSFSLAPLLLHSPDVPELARTQLAAALADPERRDEHLLAAAQTMHHELAVDCADALELVGLSPQDGCCG